MNFNKLYKQFLAEARVEDIQYKTLNLTDRETTDIAKIKKLYIELGGHESGEITKIAQLFNDLNNKKDEADKAIKELRDQFKNLDERFFNPEDVLLTRVIRTKSYLIKLASYNPAEKETKSLDEDKALVALDNILKLITETAPQLVDKYNELTKDIMKVKKTTGVFKISSVEPVEESLGDSVVTYLKYMLTRFSNMLKAWLPSFDSKLNEIDSLINNSELSKILI